MKCKKHKDRADNGKTKGWLMLADEIPKILMTLTAARTDV